jgi:hypothetical protein
MSWAREELRHTNLGDARLNRRLVGIVEDLMSSPESSVPQASRSASALQGMYDFWRKLSGKTRGLKLHSVLCVNGNGTPYGVIHPRDLMISAHTDE